LERGILVRDIGIPNTLRITAGTEAETTAVIAALTDLLGGK
jgi:histidinol-phosphate aminotransferase